MLQDWILTSRWFKIISRTLPPITKTIQVRWNRHAGHGWRSRDELISDILLWTPSHGRAKAGQAARTYIHQLCADTGCSPEDLLEAMDDREGWKEGVRDINVDRVTWWWWWWWSIFYVARMLSPSIQLIKTFSKRANCLLFAFGTIFLKKE